MITLVLILAVLLGLMALMPGSPFEVSEFGVTSGADVRGMGWWLLHGQYFYSFQLHAPLNEILLDAFVVSFFLGFTTLISAAFLAIPCGCLLALSQNIFFDIILSCGLALPSYLIGSFLLLAAPWMHLPSALWESPASMILPAVTLGMRPFFVLTSITRTSMRQVLSEPYITYASAQGVPWLRVLFRHALPNAALPIVGITGSLTSHLVTGSFVVESMYQIPGLGKYLIIGVMNRDYPLALGCVFLCACVLILVGVCTDLVLAYLDPRL